MGFFEDKLAATGRAFDSVVERAAGSNSPGALGRRTGEIAAWLRDRAERLDDALAHRGIHVSTLRIARVAAVVTLVGVTVWSFVHAARATMADPVVAVTPAEEEHAQSISNSIARQKQTAATAGMRPGPRTGAGPRPRGAHGHNGHSGNGR